MRNKKVDFWGITLDFPFQFLPARQIHVHGYTPPLRPPSSSPLCACFTQSESDEPQQDEETWKESTQAPYVTPPPSTPSVIVRWPPITIATDLRPLRDILLGLQLMCSRFPSLSTIVRSARAIQSYRRLLRARAYSACVVPNGVPQFQPPTLTSPVSEISPEGDETDGGLVQSKQELVAVKCVPHLRGRTEKLADLQRELELVRA
jgi:hypothetical protein